MDLDFNGGPNSWFDFWHTHVDWKGHGNDSWEARLPYLNELVRLFNELKSELKQYPKEYQLWMLIDEQDSGEDAVYIHSPNPNEENFPLVVENVVAQISDNNLKDFIESLKLTVVQLDTMEGRMFYLFDNKAGIPLINHKQ
ncbi:MAG: hypothetical protein ICV84_15595 [Flavisolibacter sp.]|nr:hypothetical protein [Flavisolibacter sp.]